MANFNDFDLDLKQMKDIRDGRDNEALSTLHCVATRVTYRTVKLSLRGTCGTSDVPTTGHSSNCCRRGKNTDNELLNEEPNCI